MLNLSNIDECKAKFNLSYHVEFAYACQQILGFQDKDVLEVGGSLPEDFVFNYLGAKSWSAVETPDYEESLKKAGGLTHTGTILPSIQPQDYSKMGFKNRTLGRYNLFLDNIENLTDEYHNQYDLVFSIATFEHINKLPESLEKMFLSLRPGGQVFSLFAPIWSGSDGHHLPNIKDQQGRQFNFGNSPIPPWGHLLMTPSEMTQHLYQYIDKETADLMVYYIYDSPHINRFFTEDYIKFFHQSSFKLNHFETVFMNETNPEIQHSLEKLHPEKNKFNNRGILVVLEKPIALNYQKQGFNPQEKTIPEYSKTNQLKTPVCLMIFNRPDTTQQVFNVIRQVKPEKLLVIADGPRLDVVGEVEKCAATRAIINQVDWDCEVLTNYSEINLGCRHRVSSGLNWVFNTVEEAIILEDDCLPDVTFFRFCEELLERYRHDPKIMAISGNNFQFGDNDQQTSYYFSRYNHIWGWATWRRAWKLYDLEMKLWPSTRENKGLEKILENPKVVAYWSNIFQGAYEGFNTWDYAWTFACWVHGGLTILPNVNLVSNIGFREDATHTTNESPLANLPTKPMSFPLQHPNVMMRNARSDNLTEAIMFSSPVSQTQPQENQDSVTILSQGIEYLNNNQNLEALNLFKKVLESFPERIEIYYPQAISQARLGQLSESIHSLKNLLSFQGNHSRGKQLLEQLSLEAKQKIKTQIETAIDLINKGEKVAALRLAESTTESGLFIPGMHYLRAICLSHVGRYEEALEAAQQELENNPSHPEAQAQVQSLTQSLIRPKKAPIPTHERPWNTALPYDLMMSIQNALHNFSYKGVPLQKNPFDFSLYPILIWNIKPQTIIEIGSKSGGSGLWFGDLMNNFGIEGHVYSIDIVKVTKVSHPRLTFLEGDGSNLGETLSPELLKSLPRPWLIIEDADHSFTTSKAVLDFFHPYLDQGEYIVVEDGIISDIIQDGSYNSGPHKALKAFLSEHRNEYEIDGEYCDFFGYNLTWGTNGYLKKLTKTDISSSTPQSIPQQFTPIEAKSTLPDYPEFQQLFQLVRNNTGLSEQRLYSLFSLAKKVCVDNIPGNFVECGVADGGSTALMAAVMKRYSKQPRIFYAFDSFEGLPEPTEEDKSNGVAAELAGWGKGSCAAPESKVLNLCTQLGVSDVVRTVKGYFQDTLPEFRNPVGVIALLHADGDWYESTKVILEQFFDRVVNDGFIQVDDYGHWEGCKKALHEFEAQNHLQFNLNKIDYTGVWFTTPNQFLLNPNVGENLLQEFNQDDPVVYGIQSQMSKNERFQLYYVLRQLIPELSSSPLRFIEIGSFAGSSLFLTCKALKRVEQNLEGFAIDPGLHPQLKTVLQQVKKDVNHLQMFSHDAVIQLRQQFEADGNFPPFIFVDGDHSYEGVKQDIINYFPLLKSGGIMMFHDYLPPLNDENRSAILSHHGGNEPGIRQACQELMEDEYGCEQIEIPLLYPTDPTQTQAYLPIIPGVFSSIRVYRKSVN
jgi:cephalosporin hydroxylase